MTLWGSQNGRVDVYSMTPKDLRVILDIERRTAPRHQSYLARQASAGIDQFTIEPPWDDCAFRLAVAGARTGAILVAELDAEIVGFSVCVGTPESSYAHILKVAVPCKPSGDQVAHALLGAVAAEMCDRGFRQLVIQVDERHARALRILTSPMFTHLTTHPGPVNGPARVCLLIRPLGKPHCR
ncbi:MAG: hypothetical protein G01um101438_272 [Parcubacteria group bacterium Gr01-1014_38]|nr:MAG: hypothetical protein G01um101438_272 [Parcubacteria group bacterium Gr01-1014_38]